MNKIDVESLIPLVKERPVIWDKTLEVYGNKVLREAAWREICLILNDGNKEKNKTQKQEFGRTVLKKWTQIRDSWCKDNKKRKNKTPYKYYDQLSFLKKVTDTRVGRDSGETKDLTYVETTEREETINEERDSDEEETENVSDSDTECSAGEETTKAGGRKTENKGSMNKTKRKQYDAADIMMKFLDNVNRQQEEDSHLHFFKSLLPVTSTLNADETLQFQAGVISLLQNIKKQRQNSYENISTAIFISPNNPLDNTDIKIFQN